MSAASIAAEAPDVSDDAFLGGRVRLWQPLKGYRAATDPVLLAAACRAAPGDGVLDVGAGVGAAAFCLGVRQPGVRLSGVEREAALARLSERNAARNGLEWRARCGDIADAPAALRGETFDHVITNPPYHAAETGLASPDRLRDGANRESLSVAAWLDFCLRRLRPRGELTLIHRAERLAEILAGLEGRAGAVEILPLWPRTGLAAKRVILRAVKESRAPLRLCAGLALHDGPNGAFTDAATAVLRDGAALDF